MKRNTTTFVLLLLLLFPYTNIAQQDKFIVGAFMQSTPFTEINQPDSALFSLWRAKALGINTALIYARLDSTDSDIQYVGSLPNVLESNMETARDFENVVAMNQTSSIGVADGTVTNDYIRNFDWIYFYTGAYYSKWDATLENTSIPAGVLGLKHDIGSKTSIAGIDYWSSGQGIPPPQESELFLVKGPNYNQETRYRSSTRSTGYSDIQTYRAYYNLKLASTPPQETLNDPICEIIVKAKYTKNCDWNTFYYDTLAVRILTVGDIGNFNKQFLDYDYSDYCANNGAWKKGIQIEDCQCTGNYLDNVEFLVRYLGNQELLINYIEVYDMGIWWPRLGNPQSQIQARQKIVTYLQRFKNANLQFYKHNLKYFFGVDEPHTVDAYIPHAFVQSVLDSLNNGWPEGAPLLFTHLYPEWDGQRNGADVFPPFVNTVKPQPFHFYYQPFWDNVLTANGLEYFRNILKQATDAIDNKDFWVTIETWEYTTGDLHWRLPTPSELNASVMLALSHGAKGIFFEPFYSYNDVKGLMKSDAPDYTPRDIGIQVRDHISPRLNGMLGDTLLRLNYTGNFLQYQYITPTQNPLPSPPNYDYLTIGLQATNHDMNWHVGFFNKPDQIDNKYFLMSNLWTNSLKSIQVKVTPPYDAQGYSNYRFRNIEPENNFDITFNTETTQTLSFPAGEGYLFQVAPVLKYGGKLVYNENVGEGITLYDDMTIENGATLTINGTYNANANITVKSGGKIVAGPNGKIIFDVGKKLIIQGSAEIKGTSSFNKLTLQYSGPDNGIVVKPGSSLILDYCNITGPYQGIATETGSQSYLYISNSTISAAYSGISLVAGTQDESFQTPPTPTIINCSITAGISGISVSNYGSVLIKANTITNSGISILNVSAAYIQNNNISLGSNSNQSGIFMNNSGGYIRSNTAKNRVNGILLANSSPDIGGNLLENNYKHGLYIGSGSFPNLVGLVQTNPPTYYPLAGYNTIRNNGTNTQPNTENDGSEIYFNYSDALLGTERNPGCNQISDDRTATPSMITIW